MGQLFEEKGGRGTAIRPPQLPHLDINVGLGPESEEEVAAGSAVLGRTITRSRRPPV